MTARQLGAAWVVVVAGPLAWFLQLTVGWAVVPPAGQGGREGVLTALALGAFAIAALSAALGGVILRSGDRDGAGDETVEARRFVALAAIVLGLLSALLIVCTALPVWILGAGAEP